MRLATVIPNPYQEGALPAELSEPRYGLQSGGGRIRTHAAR